MTDSTSLSFTVLSPPAVKSVSTTKLIKHRVKEGTSTINIVFSEAMAPLAGSSGFYSLETPTKVRVHGKLETKLIPVRFKARSTGANSVSLKRAEAIQLHPHWKFTAAHWPDPAPINGLSVGRTCMQRGQKSTELIGPPMDCRASFPAAIQRTKGPPLTTNN